jgi:hypothetical protein
MFNAVKARQHRIAIALRCHGLSCAEKSLCNMTSTRMAMPTTAKALFIASENQLANPLNRPHSEPRLRSTKKYVPPALGIAVDNSALLKTLGIIRIEARRYDNMIAGPAFEKAIAGRIKRPELIIAPAAIENTAAEPSCFLSKAISESAKLITNK